MIVLNQIEKEVREYLTRYDKKVTNKYLRLYLKFYAEEILENYYDKGARKSYAKYLKNKADCFVRLKNDEIILGNDHLKYSRVAGKYFGSTQARIRLYFQIKQDFIAMGFLVRTCTSQIFRSEDGVITSTKEIFQVNLPKDLSYKVEDSDDELGEWDDDWDFWDYNTDYLIYYKDLLALQSKLSAKEFVKVYAQYRRLKRTGYKIYVNQRDTGEGYRLYHSFSFLNEKLRAIIRDAGTKEFFKSIDLVSSHLFFLAERTKNQQLYEDIKSRKIKDFDKVLLLQWLNSQNYEAKCYGKINEYFKKIDLNTASLRDEKGLYNTLAKMESNYILRDISDRYNHPHFTVHDQIYYLESKEKELSSLLRALDSNFHFLPVWSAK